MGRPHEAVREAKRALELDPLSLIINENVGDVLGLARRYDEAIEQLHKTLELDPNFRVARNSLARAYEGKEMYDEAVAEFLKVVGPEIALPLKEAYIKSGIRGLWEKQLELAIEQSKQSYVSPYLFAWLYANLGKKDEALGWLEKAVAEHSINLVYLRSSIWDSLRSDPRYIALLKKVGLE